MSIVISTLHNHINFESIAFLAGSFIETKLNLIRMHLTNQIQFAAICFNYKMFYDQFHTLFSCSLRRMMPIEMRVKVASGFIAFTSTMKPTD